MPENTQMPPVGGMRMLKQNPNYIEGTESTRTQVSSPFADDVEAQGFGSTKKPMNPSLNMSEHTMYLTALPSTGGRKLTEMQVLRARCRQLGLAVFFQDKTSVRSLGFTSAIPGEGKTFLAKLTAEIMAEENDIPVTLLECNWDHPTLCELYNLPPGPGLSDVFLGKAPLMAARRQVARNLTIIPAGEDTSSAPKLLRELQQKGLQNLLASPDEVVILDLPPTATTAYGPLAAHLADALILVIRMGVTPQPFVSQACKYLDGLPVQGVILNQVVSRIPRWLRRIL